MVDLIQQSCDYVYGPVNSWRYGRSLGIDPIGLVSTCSFDCVYCQLGEIENKSQQRQIFVSTARILKDLQAFSPWNVDVITLSGSGEPTLALNLEEIIVSIKKLTDKPVLVLTNGTLLNDSSVRQGLSLADKVSVKLDAISSEQLKHINRPVAEIHWHELWSGIQKFRSEFRGEFAIQTMMMSPWNRDTRNKYIDLMRSLDPDEIQLNTPTRPKPLQHRLEARGNYSQSDPYFQGDRVKTFHLVSTEILQAFANEIQSATGICVRFPATISE
jgi:wyosine [tRNA(Phe)-imidazoG37] synthetase (radical SAM superfamily)